MKTSEILSPIHTQAAKIARQIVYAASKSYVAEDWNAAIEKAIVRFADNMREAAKQEIRFMQMRKIPPKTGI